MKILLLVAHPNPSSFNHAIAGAVANQLARDNHEVVYHDLYAEEFDPILQLEELKDDFEPEGLLEVHCRDLKNAKGIVIVHPNWRDQPPAILKGWVDRVFRTGVAFGYEGEKGKEGQLKGMLKAQAALVINTSDCSESREVELGDPLQTLWETCILKSCGVKEISRVNFTGVLFSTNEQRTAWIQQACRLASIFREG